MANNTEQKKKFRLDFKAPLRWLYPFMDEPPKDMKDLQKFKKEHPDLGDHVFGMNGEIPKDYRRPDPCNWDYLLKNSNRKEWAKDDKPKMPIQMVNPSHDNNVNLFQILEDSDLRSQLADEVIYFNQNDEVFQILVRLQSGSRGRYSTHTRDSNLRNNVKSNARVNAMTPDMKRDATHLLPYGYHGSDSDTRLLIMFPSVLNQGPMNSFEKKVAKYPKDIYWYASIERKYRKDRYDEVEENIYEENENGEKVFAGTKMVTRRIQEGGYLDWHYKILDVDTGAVVAEEHFIADDSSKFGGTGDYGTDSGLSVDWNFGTDEATTLDPNNVDWQQGVYPQQDKKYWRYDKVYRGHHGTDDPTMACFGEDFTSKKAVWVSLSKCVHILVCGTTGSGKSVAVDGLIKSVQAHSTPDEVQFFGIDPKFVEYKQHENSPYWLFPPQEIPTSGQKHDNAHGAMKMAINIMECRYLMISAVGAKNLQEYNAWVENNPIEARELGLFHLAYIFIPIDEYADLMEAVGQDIEKDISRLGAKGRASGIHLILTTQRPSYDVISSTLKSNLPTVYCLTVNNSISSNIALGEDGAERLTGQGDGLIKLQGADSLIRTKALYFNPDETTSINQALKDVYGKQPDIDFMNLLVYMKQATYLNENVDGDTPVKDKKIEIVKKRRGA